MTILQHSIVPSSGYQISRSLRFNPADSAYLNRTPAGAGNRTTWTWSGWIKFSKITGYQYVFGASSDNYVSNFTLLQMDNSASTVTFYDYTSAFNFTLIPSMVFRDPSAWYHIVLTYDSNNATSSDRVRMYVNGSRITAFSTATYPTSGKTTVLNSTVVHNHSTSSYPISGYLTEVNFIDGQALTPSSFGETNSDTGVWKPKAFSGTYGTNGFYLNFSDNSGTTATTLGKDYSGNGNNWTPNNFSVTAGDGNDSLVDTPTPYGSDTGAGGEVRGNYCTMNPLDLNDGSFSNGNLTCTTLVSGGNGYYGSWYLSSGKWFWEFTPTTNGNISYSGISSSRNAYNIAYYGSSGNKYVNGVASAYGATYTTNDVIGVALDMDAGTVTFYKNGASQGAISIGNSGPFTAWVADGSSGASVTYQMNFGQRPFSYAAPSGYKALCTQNLPTPTIGATSTTTANKYMDVSLYSGTSASQSVTNSGSMQPDLVWIKSRSAATDHKLTDAVRGTTKGLISNTTGAETTDTNGLTAFNSNGFTVGSDSVYNNGTGPATYVGWQWNAGGSNATNTSGTITSTVRANTTAGFSVVTYTGTGVNATVGHGLGVTPAFFTVKRRSSTGNWMTWHTSLAGSGPYVILNSTNAVATGAWNNTNPTSTVFSLLGSDTDENANGSTYVAYVWAAVAGYSAFGSYTGNGSSTDGPFVYLGFRPRWIMFKDTGAASQWRVWDTSRNPYNLCTNAIYANSSLAEQTGDNYIDIVSNGFKIRSNNAGVNTSAETYIYAAFAESPFKYSLAR